MVGSQGAQHFVKMGIGADTVGQQLAEVVECRWYGVDEVLLALKIATETVGTEHLQRAEKDEEAQTAVELRAWGQRGVLLSGGVILVYQFLSQIIGIAGRGLPKEGGEVVVVGAAASALEVDEIALTIDH